MTQRRALTAACLALAAAPLAGMAAAVAGAAPGEVRLGWFGPSDPADPDGGPFWNGATLAVEEINAADGVAGRPVRLVPGWSENPWAGGVNRIARMVYDDGVVAVIGSIDGAATHLAEQVAAKALVAVVSPGSTDPTVNLAGVPWMYSLLPGDDVQARAVAAYLAAEPGRRPIALVSATDHDARAAAAAFRTAFRAAGLTFDAAFESQPDAADAAAVAGLVVAGASRAVVVLASAAASGRLAAALRAAGYDGVITGGANLGRRRFLGIAAAAAHGVIVPLVHDPEAPRWRTFSRAYAVRFGAEPDFTAGAAYDAVRITAEAARRAGLDRGRLLEAARTTAPGGGVTGEVTFDRLGRNGRPVRLGVVRDGRLEPLAPRRDLH
jgi:ABC-type branched-subunit amino acid transport system substrate-binding protein